MRRLALLTSAWASAWASALVLSLGVAHAGGVRHYTGPTVQAMPSTMAAPVSARAEGGCWQTYDALYGKYKIAFCLGAQGQGSYRVKGAGYDCRGRSTWRDQGDVLVYQMARGTCGAQADWTPDQIVCKRSGGFKRGLTCTYAPAVTGHAQARFSAFKQ